MAHTHNHASFLCQLAELGVSLNSEQLRTASWQLLRLLPPDMATRARIQTTHSTHNHAVMLQQVRINIFAMT